jgi:hypothetical protein
MRKYTKIQSKKTWIWIKLRLMSPEINIFIYGFRTELTVFAITTTYFHCNSLGTHLSGFGVEPDVMQYSGYGKAGN